MISGYAPADPNRAARLPASAAATWLRMDYGWLINTLPNLNKMQSTRHNMYVYIYIYYRIFMLIACANSFRQMFHVWLHLLVSFLSLNASGWLVHSLHFIRSNQHWAWVRSPGLRLPRTKGGLRNAGPRSHGSLAFALMFALNHETSRLIQ